MLQDPDLITIAATGVPQRISPIGTPLPACWAQVFGRVGNAGQMAVGGPNVTVADSYTFGSGEAGMFFPFAGSTKNYDFQNYFVVGTANDILVLQRFTK